MKSYDYSHRSGVRQLSWDDFSGMARQIAEQLEPHHPQVILGIARAGLFPATAIACSLHCEFFPIRITRRINDQVVYERPMWKVPIPKDVKGKTIAIVDEIADTGETLAVARDEALALGAAKVITAVMVSHSWADPIPAISALISDQFVIFPWGTHVLVDGKWILHPEIESGLKAQS